MADRTPDLRTLEAEITAKAIAGVELLLEDAIDRWEVSISDGSLNPGRAATLAGRLERARTLAAEIQALAAQMAQQGR